LRKGVVSGLKNFHVRGCGQCETGKGQWLDSGRTDKGGEEVGDGTKRSRRCSPSRSAKKGRPQDGVGCAYFSSGGKRPNRETLTTVSAASSSRKGEENRPKWRRREFCQKKRKERIRQGIGSLS